MYVHEMTYLELHFLDVPDTQYCPLTYCPSINATTIHTPLRRNVSVAAIVRDLNRTTNATAIHTMLMTTYGCSLEFDQCMVSDAYRSRASFLLQIVSMLVVVVLHDWLDI